MRKIINNSVLACILAASFWMTGCANNTSDKSVESDRKIEESTSQSAAVQGEIMSASEDVFAMDTYMTVTCYGERCEEALKAAVSEIERLDELLSVGNPESEISKINSQGSGTMSGDTLTMVKESLELWDTTDGSFDITVYPLMELWGFTTGNFAVPKDDRIQELLKVSGSDKLKIEDCTLTLGVGQGIDLGGIAKGFTSSRIMEIFKEYDLVSGVVSLGGNVQCYKTKTDGSLWKVGIQYPHNADNGSSLMGVIEIEDKAVITSGAYERYFIEEGKKYHHILDPKTGYPAEKGLMSVSVVSKNGMLADGLSTACYVMGLDKSIEYWRTYGDDFDLIIMTDEEKIYITEGIKDSFTSDYPVETVEREE